MRDRLQAGVVSHEAKIISRLDDQRIDRGASGLRS
jgi:hypothetical protein